MKRQRKCSHNRHDTRQNKTVILYVTLHNVHAENFVAMVTRKYVRNHKDNSEVYKQCKIRFEEVQTGNAHALHLNITLKDF
jgi:hypothetical protein